MNLDAYLDRVVDEERSKDCRNKGSARWLEEEDAYLRENLGKLPESKIAAHLRRSICAVHIRWKWELRLPAPSKHPDYMTTNQIAEALGIDNHGPISWVDRGFLPGERIPSDNGSKIRRVKKSVLYRWLLVPEHWIYLKIDRVVDPEIRKILERAIERWGDEWWTTRQAADYYGNGIQVKDIIRQIKLGRLPGIQAIDPAGRNPNGRWNYWYVRRSDVEKLVIPRKKRDRCNKR